MSTVAGTSATGADLEPVGRRGWMPWLGLAGRLLLGGVLLVAGALKVGNPQESQMAVNAYDIVGWEASKVIGTVLPFIEIFVGALLVLGLFTRFSALVGTLLMIVFIAGIASAWARGLSIDCGCFGNGGEVEAGRTRYLSEILRDTALALAGALLVWRPSTPVSLDRFLFGTTGDPR